VSASSCTAPTSTGTIATATTLASHIILGGISAQTVGDAQQVRKGTRKSRDKCHPKR